MLEPLLHDDPHPIGSYRPTARLGSGGMGTVYLARSPGGRTVALKTMHARIAAGTTFHTRFRLEVDAARFIGGLHGVRVLDADPLAETPPTPPVPRSAGMSRRKLLGVAGVSAAVVGAGVWAGTELLGADTSNTAASHGKTGPKKSDLLRPLWTYDGVGSQRYGTPFFHGNTPVVLSIDRLVALNPRNRQGTLAVQKAGVPRSDRRRRIPGLLRPS
ncbi:hypothetical protein [Streptomyces sp. NPDC014734]|uniref:hypothetical protein n=1 Tax=Streptomyces sp. NPDC014734 TaxID=3364886 RepID=UPI0037021495